MKKLLYFLFVVLLLFFFLSAQEEKQVNINEQYRQTMRKLEILSNGILDYQNDFKNAPQVKSVKELVEHDVGNGLSFSDFYLEQIPEDQIPIKDAWGNDLIYKFQNEKYWIASAGSDGKFAGFEQKGVYIDSDKEIGGKDIIISNKGFVFFPIEEQIYQFSQRCLNVILKK